MKKGETEPQDPRGRVRFRTGVGGSSGDKGGWNRAGGVRGRGRAGRVEGCHASI